MAHGVRSQAHLACHANHAPVRPRHLMRPCNHVPHASHAGSQLPRVVPRDPSGRRAQGHAAHPHPFSPKLAAHSALSTPNSGHAATHAAPTPSRFVLASGQPTSPLARPGRPLRCCTPCLNCRATWPKVCYPPGQCRWRHMGSSWGGSWVRNNGYGRGGSRGLDCGRTGVECRSSVRPGSSLQPHPRCALKCKLLIVCLLEHITPTIASEYPGVPSQSQSTQFTQFCAL